MSADPDPLPPEELEAALTEVYAGALEDFIARRDELARRLKATGQKDESARVKKLRKPARLAWVLNTAFFADSSSVERVAAAVRGVIEAQDGVGDMRSATAGLRDAVQAVAGVAADAAAERGHTADRSTIVPAMLAVVADAEAFAALRRGQLGEVPSGGGLDVLTNPPDLVVSGPPALYAVPDPQPAPPADKAAVDRAQAKLDAAEAAAAEARDAADAVDREIEEASAEVEAHEEALRQAEADVRAAHGRLREAKLAARKARDQVRKADQEAARARAALAKLTS